MMTLKHTGTFEKAVNELIMNTYTYEYELECPFKSVTSTFLFFFF